MDPEAARIEHLKLVQAVISRLGRNSFAIKSTAAAASAALIAFIASTASPAAAFAGLVLLPLWVLDARFLAQERGFRRFYDSVRKGPAADCGSEGYFEMKAPPPAGNSDRVVGVLSSSSLFLFYVPLLVLIGVSSFVALL